MTRDRFKKFRWELSSWLTGLKKLRQHCWNDKKKTLKNKLLDRQPTKKIKELANLLRLPSKWLEFLFWKTQARINYHQFNIEILRKILNLDCSSLMKRESIKNKLHKVEVSKFEIDQYNMKKFSKN